MLSQNLSNVAKISRNKIFPFFPALKLSTSCTKFNLSGDIKSKEEKPERKLKQWVDDPVVKEPGFLGSSDNFFGFLQVEIEMTPQGIKKFIQQKMKNSEIERQKFRSDRHKILGPDLSLAYFIIENGGKIKFKGKKGWFHLMNRNSKNLPNAFDPNYVVEEIDMSDIMLFYEGLKNFENIPRVKKAIFARSPYFDDWYVDRVSSLFPHLEYLDISDCPGVTERGLEALYRTSWLKTLIVTNHNKSAAFELTCMMLEDVVSGLQVNILEPKNK